jgi:exo-beta-1,3-glucanase (GH17 family)
MTGGKGEEATMNVRNRLTTLVVPITTTEQIDDYYSQSWLLDLGDFILPNAHPFWHGLTQPQAVEQFAALHALMAARGVGHKPLLFKEVGLPSAGCSACAKGSQADYYARLARAKLEGRLLLSYFEAYDQPWKTAQANVQPFSASP